MDNTDYVSRSMKDLKAGNDSGNKLRYDPTLRRIVPSYQVRDPDRAIALTPKDMTLSAE